MAWVALILSLVAQPAAATFEANGLRAGMSPAEVERVLSQRGEWMALRGHPWFDGTIYRGSSSTLIGYAQFRENRLILYSLNMTGTETSTRSFTEATVEGMRRYGAPWIDGRTTQEGQNRVHTVWVCWRPPGYTHSVEFGDIPGRDLMMTLTWSLDRPC